MASNASLHCFIPVKEYMGNTCTMSSLTLYSIFTPDSSTFLQNCMIWSCRTSHSPNSTSRGGSRCKFSTNSVNINKERKGENIYMKIKIKNTDWHLNKEVTCSDL